MTDFTTHTLADGEHQILTTRLPEALLGQTSFERWWSLHPEAFSQIMIHGRMVEIPRWQQAYGKDYHFSGTVNEALDLTPEMQAVLEWCQQSIDARLNGLLFNWYDGAQDHYIGAHRDSRQGLIEGTPIVTISLGEERPFRMRPYRQKGFEDFLVGDGDVLVIPWKTNLTHTHEVPNAARYTDRRISITARAFEDD
jgi:alkylated DNA repair dioxygenase AlkB